MACENPSLERKQPTFLIPRHPIPLEGLHSLTSNSSLGDMAGYFPSALARKIVMQQQDVARVLRDPLAQELMQSSIPARLA